MSNSTEKIERALTGFLPVKDGYIDTVVSSMEYSLTAGGKRVRPMLVLEFARLCGGSEEAALPFACAVEMIHTYSLIHDDLPCMDDDDMRRGKPTNHKVFGEAQAVLGGDALLTRAFEIILSDEAVSLNGADRCVRAGRTLACCAGAEGMIGGQIIDIESEELNAGLERLRIMDDKKTGALIRAACLLGCISAGAEDRQMKAAEAYASSIGLAFQIVDDILDVTSDTETLGKPAGSDEQNKKSTYVSCLGLEKCRELTRELTDKAIKSLSVFNGDTGALINLAEKLRDRDK